MILDKIELHNFGVYQGRQVIELTPPDPNKPVVLVGGLNGTGKTTLLDAIRLIFYGKRANCSNRGKISYQEFLRRSISHGVDSSEGAALELEFRQVTEGTEHTYRIHRSWRENGKGLSEQFEVSRNGRIDPVLTEGWSEMVEEFMPARISDLFYFDGEKIEALADFENSCQLLSVAIHSLLGLNLIDQLVTDLIVLERKKQSELKTVAEQVDIEKTEQEVNDLNFTRQNILQKRACSNCSGPKEEATRRHRNQISFGRWRTIRKAGSIRS